MGTRGPLERDPEPRAEVLHASERTQVTRLVLPAGTVVRKEPLGRDAQARLHQELAMLERLRGVTGVPQLADAPRYEDSIVMADIAGTSLVEVAKPLAVDELIALALQLARAIAAMHRRGVLHRDIAPANILVSRDGACLVDFASATSLNDVGPGVTHRGEIVGTLEYAAPEQSGRTGQPVDQRSDLYALGATLYELATGKPPFTGGDALQLTHDHLARVPLPPAEANPALPAALSDVIMHLLEKEPAHRYQSAEGLEHDLERLAADPAAGTLRVGEYDTPLRLRAPSRLVGRETEVAALEAAFTASRSGACRGVLISGAAGVGKTALADALRPVVASAGGWFVAGKFDQLRRDLEFDAVNQSLRALGRLLLSEPEAELAAVRPRILDAVGANAGLLTATVPEFAALLDVPAAQGDPLTAQARAQQITLRVLQAVASPERPLVVFLDDLQWAGRTTFGAVDLVLGEEATAGLLLVVAYREGELDEAALSRWGDADVRRVQVGDLPPGDLITIVADVLRTDSAAAAGLAELIEPHTHGNPFETVEALGALHRDGLLTAKPGGWRWEASAVRAHLGPGPGMPPARADSLPAETRELLETMACLGGRAELPLVEEATGEHRTVLEQRLAPALVEGVVVSEDGVPPAVRFRHDRIREGILRRMDPRHRSRLQLAAARRLARVPERFADAAEQYLPVTAALADPGERWEVAALLRRAAERSATSGDHARVDELLAAALELVEPDGRDDLAPVIEMRTSRQAALFSLGRLEEADAEYRHIELLCPTALERPAATAVQIRGLSHRNRFAEAIDLGLESLRECGIAVPAERGFAEDLDSRFERLYSWLDGTDPADDLTRPEVADPALLAATHLIDATLPVAYFVADPALIAWLALEALRVWIEHGPGPTLVGPSGHAAYHAGAQRGQNAAAYRGLQRIVALGEARGYEPGTSQARHMLAAMSGWYEPVENGVRMARRARGGLIAGADLAYAGYTYQLSVPYSVECAPSLARFRDEVDAGLAFLRRTGNEQTGQWLESYQWLVHTLRAESATAAGEDVPLDRYADSPLALFYARLCHALASAVFGDAAGLAEHSAAAMELLPAAAGFYSVAQVRFLRGLAVAERARSLEPAERAESVSELEELTSWFVGYAADAPDNFLHLLRLLEAERAWAVGDFRAAASAFDAARREVAGRPWHQAVIAERAARFHLAHGLQESGRDLLGDARRHYLAWGATAKVERMDWAHPALRPEEDEAGDRRFPITSGTIDLLGVLSASQALSSETSMERLHERVASVLGAMTGATDVNVLLWSDSRQQWLLPARDSAGGMIAISEGEAPQSVLRYVQRTQEPLVVADVAQDDRFARDPYFTGLDRGSLLAVPIVGRGALRALLLLENRLLRDAFSSERLDVVKLIAGQLAVSLDNAQLYEESRRIAEQQAALRRVATLVAEGREPSAVFAAAADEIKRLLDADGVTLGRYQPGDTIEVVAHRGFQGWELPIGGRFSHRGRSVTSIVHQTGRPSRMNRYELAQGPMAQLVRELGVRSSVGAPILLGGRLWGVAVAYWSRIESAPADSEERVGHFAQLLESAIANAESRDQLIASRARLLVAGDEARRHVVRDLHDGAQQRLVQAIVTLKLAQRALEDGDDEATSLVDEALEAAQKGNEELRELAHGILPTVLTHGGLRGAVNAIAERVDVPVAVEIPDERFPPEIEASAYFIVAEALTNIVKHAQATHARVRASMEDGTLRVEVHDDGVGGADTSRHGLMGISDRVAALQGRLELESPPGAGTTVVATLPIPPA